MMTKRSNDQVGWTALRTGETQNWENPETGSWGQVRVSKIGKILRQDTRNGGVLFVVTLLHARSAMIV